MENLDKKLEEQITFLQQEISQLSSELYSQQKEIKDLKKQIINLINRIEEIDSENVQSLISEDKKPPHY
ncbi:SlyX family protein [Candidatus Pelagibacter sp.]|jgi:SlyX protein|nr:SlyX family protein [Candidatus Pelagibacter sp.]MDA8612394.1 SlyX family protein [Candidatus Pelagibacter bacterium]MDB9769206.1 SlyX family protein [bacterium]MDC1416137.1 SlyX family protein [Pelagibacteraceae bacterium]MDA7823929.1 SlyX family protein [Candidatus Pelagibacter sp.]|tara:strand:- start:1078 stop:1284 length:207 start_codon:yes stop_codon:yes gene_type:complete